MLLIAELHGKLENHQEDELTGNFFGTLRYVDSEKILRPLLEKCVRPNNFAVAVKKIDDGWWADKIKFWPHDKLGEIDLLLDFDKVLIGVEVKYHSGESGTNQLEREAGILQRRTGNKEKILILLAPESTCLDVVTPARRKRILADFGVRLGYVAWEDVFDTLKNFPTHSQLERLIVDELTKLLAKKGFNRFRSFDDLIAQPTISPETVTFTFDESSKQPEVSTEKTVVSNASNSGSGALDFSDFDFDIQIKKDEAYEFH